MVEKDPAHLCAPCLSNAPYVSNHLRCSPRMRRPEIHGRIVIWIQIDSFEKLVCVLHLSLVAECERVVCYQHCENRGYPVGAVEQLLHSSKFSYKRLTCRLVGGRRAPSFCCCETIPFKPPPQVGPRESMLWITLEHHIRDARHAHVPLFELRCKRPACGLWETSIRTTRFEKVTGPTVDWHFLNVWQTDLSQYTMEMSPDLSLTL